MLRGSVPLVKYGPRPKLRPLRKLLGDLSSGSGSSGSTDGSNPGEIEEDRGSWSSSKAKSPSSARRDKDRGNYISFWKPEVSEYDSIYWVDLK